MSLEKEFVPFDLAVGLKELGFDEKCLGGYVISDDCQFFLFGLETGHDFAIKTSEDPENWLCSPLWQQAFQWFHKEFNLCSWIESDDITFDVNILDISNGKMYKMISYLDEESKYRFLDIDAARVACTSKLIEIV